jgi:replication initiation and membrane attachment protein DnaB
LIQLFGPIIGILKLSFYMFLLNLSAMYALKVDELYKGERGTLLDCS